MRITLLLGALSAIIVSTAMALNDTTAAAPTFAVDIQAHHPKPSGPRKIPVTMMKCTNHILSEEDYLGAKEKMISWSANGGRVYPGSYQAKGFPDDRSGATWYLCNCKGAWADKAPRWELDYVQQILEEKCGKWQSGWVWSKKWQKGFNIAPTDGFLDRQLYLATETGPQQVSYVLETRS
ncbi:hypothetical protein CIB48_g4597 [Xylaria polymorpha]|nr:hypothetical protein CIB48_g4597 [Xylaria polymorpha]